MAEVCSGGEGGEGTLSAAARARMERNRLRARALQDARLVHRAPAVPPDRPAAAAAAGAAARALDSGGGFLLEPEGAAGAAAGAARAAHAPAPLVHASEQPHCLRCEKPFPLSYLFDTFDYCVCDACREPEGAHALLTRTEAKSEYLLQDCDLDARAPPLRAERRRNPHRPGGADMRLYLRAQLHERALLVWGSSEGLQAARERREERRISSRSKQAERRVRALRRDMRSGLFVKARGKHEHRWGAERRDPAAGEDSYTRACLDCGHEESYEKM